MFFFWFSSSYREKSGKKETWNKGLSLSVLVNDFVRFGLILLRFVINLWGNNWFFVLCLMFQVFLVKILGSWGVKGKRKKKERIRWISVVISRRRPWQAVRRWGWKQWCARNLEDWASWTNQPLIATSDPSGHLLSITNQRWKIQELGLSFWISFSPREDAMVRDLGAMWLHHPHFSVDLHLVGLQTLWSKMSNLVVVMVMKVLVHFPWHHLHHLPQLEVVLGWSLVTLQLQWGLKVLIASAGIGATAAFLLLHNSILNQRRKKKKKRKRSQRGRVKNHQSSKSRGDFWDWGANLNFNLIVLYVYTWSYCSWVN